MNADLDKLEQTVEQEMTLLRGLPPVAPRAECLARVKAAVVAESIWVARRRRVLRLGGMGGVAAAVGLLVFGWTAHVRSAERGTADADAVVAGWAVAVDESNSRLTSLIEYGWTHGEFGRDEDAELDGLLQSLDQSFEEFDAL